MFQLFYEELHVDVLFKVLNDQKMECNAQKKSSMRKNIDDFLGDFCKGLSRCSYIISNQ